VNREQLAEEIISAINNALDNGTVERDEVSQIIAGVSEDCQAILLWSIDEWEDYDSHDEDRAFAEISNASWLDEVDRILLPDLPSSVLPQETENQAALRIPLKFCDPKQNALFRGLVLKLRDELVGALRLVAVSGKLGKFSNMVGLMGQGISKSGYADLVAFYHPKGNLPILPIHEHRGRDTDVYQFGVCTSEGVTMFYPEGEGDGLEEDNLPSSSKEYLFADMVYFRGERHDIWFRIKGELYDIYFSAGHCHDEWGGLSQDEVMEILTQHFRTQPHLEFDPYTMSDPSDKDTFMQWFTLFQELSPGNPFIKVFNSIDKGLEDYGPDAATSFLDLLEEGSEQRPEVIRCFGRYLLQQGDSLKALELFESLEGQNRLYEWKHELRALLDVKRPEDLLSRADELCREDEKYLVESAPLRAMALSSLGKQNEARELMDTVPLKKREELYWWAMACIAARENESNAIDYLHSAFAKGPARIACNPADLEGFPELLRLYKKREQLHTRAGDDSAAAEEVVKRITAEVLEIDSRETPLAYLDTVDEVYSWNVSQTLEYEDKRSVKKLVKKDGDTVCALMKDGTISRYTLSPSHGAVIEKKTDYNFKGSDIAFHEGFQFIADWPRGLVVIHDDGKELLEKEYVPGRFFSDKPGSVAVDSTGKLAVATGNRGAELYDISDPENPQFLSLAATGYPRENYYGKEAVIEGDVLYVAAGWGGLLTFDIGNPAEPKILGGLSLQDQEFIAERIELHREYAVIYSRNSVWLVNIKNRKAPESICLIRGDRLEIVTWQELEPEGNAERFLLVDGGGDYMWVLEVGKNNRPRITEVMPIQDEEGEAKRLTGLNDAVIIDDSHLITFTDYEIFVLEKSKRPSLDKTIEESIFSLEDGIVGWIDEQLRDYGTASPGYPLGVLVLAVNTDACEISLDIPRSAAGINSGPVNDEKLEYAFTSFNLSFEERPGMERVGPWEDSNCMIGELTCLKRDRALFGLSSRVLMRVKDLESFRNIMAGRVYLMSLHDYDKSTVVDIAVDETRPWVPWRKEIQGDVALSPEEELQEFDFINKYVRLGKEDEEIRRIVFETAGRGVIPALRAAWKLRDVDAEGVREACMTAARSEYVNDEIIERLAQFIDNPEVRALLEYLFSNPPANLKSRDHNGSFEDRILVELAVALGRCEDDRIIDLVKGMLKNLDYRSSEFVTKAMNGMSKRLKELEPSLRQYIADADEGDRRLPAICIQLFRAGCRELPEKLLTLSQREKRNEQYASVKLGITFLDEEYQTDSCRAERLFTGFMLSEHIKALNRSNDRTTSAWPAELEPEPWPASWKFLLRSALPVIEANDDLQFFTDLLCGHVENREGYTPDHVLLRGLFDYFYNSNNIEGVMQAGEAILAGKEVYSQGTRNSIQDKLVLARVQYGWNLKKEGKLAEARKVADELLEIDPDNGQLLFFDARLHWLETGSPSQGISRAHAYISRVGSDPAGKGRLFNLIGCALDEDGKVEDAVDYFKKAATEDPRDPAYLANIAECYEKLGNTPEALKFAQSAIQLKSSSELCQRIVREHSDSEGI